MFFKSKFPGRCDVCGESIDVGEDIWWEKTADETFKAHRQCAVDEVETDSAPIKAVQKGVTARFNPPPKQAPRHHYDQLEGYDPIDPQQE